MALTQFQTPGAVDDVDDAGKQAWSDIVSDMLDENGRGITQFVNPLKKDSTGAALRDMVWGAFPRKLAREPAPQRWELGEERDRQEEYGEWMGVNDSQDRLARVLVTTEVPEYYEFLARHDPDALLEIYREHLNPNVRLSELMTAGTYDRRNPWNMAGAMHLVQRFNTLQAAVRLVAESSVQKQRGGLPVTNGDDLIACGIAADADRNSDPLIVTEVNALARAKHFISLRDPVGLYIDGLRTAGWRTPDDEDPATFWKVTRGIEGFAVRAEYVVPSSRGYTVNDITINGRPIDSPSQIAEFVDIRVTGIAFGRSSAQPKQCGARGGGLQSLDAPTVTLADVTAANAPRG